MDLPTEGAPFSVKIWDLPVRVTHWAFVALLPALWWTAEEGDMTLHKQLGLVMLGFVIFRLLWGFFGSSTARFSKFLTGPRQVLAYARGLFSKSDASVGHNPMGAWSVVALLTALVLQVAIGLFAQDVDGLESGPLSYLVDYDTADAAREWHELLFNVILGFVGLHLVAIAFYVFVKRDNIVKPMLSGGKSFADKVDAPLMAPPLRALVCIVTAAVASWWVSIGAPIPGLTG